MSDQVQERWFQIVCSIAVAALGWTMWRSVTHDAQISALGYQIQGVVQSSHDVIPPSVEASLREIRDKENGFNRDIMAQLAKITENSINNTNQISYLKEQFAKQAK
jgi:hypothetical protein